MGNTSMCRIQSNVLTMSEIICESSDTENTRSVDGALPLSIHCLNSVCHSEHFWQFSLPITRIADSIESNWSMMCFSNTSIVDISLHLCACHPSPKSLNIIHLTSMPPPCVRSIEVDDQQQVNFGNSAG